MKKMLILGLILTGSNLPMIGAQDSELEKRKLIGLFASAFEESDFNKFVQQYARINNPNALYEGLPLLYWAVNAPNPILYIQYLLNQGAEINKQGLHGINALMQAARKGKFDTVDYLLGHGAKPELKNRRGQTALDMAQASLATFKTKLDMDMNLGADESILQLRSDTIEALIKTISILEAAAANIPAEPPAPIPSPGDAKREQEQKIVSQDAPPGGPAIEEQVTVIPRAPTLTPAEIQAIIDASRAAEAPLVPAAPPFSPLDAQNLAAEINNFIAQQAAAQAQAAIPAAPAFTDADMKRFMEAAAIPIAPLLTQEEIQKITEDMNRRISEQQPAPTPSQPRPSAPAGSVIPERSDADKKRRVNVPANDAIQALNSMQTLLLRYSARPTFNQWQSKFNKQARFNKGGSGQGLNPERDYEQLQLDSTIIGSLGDNEQNFITAYLTEYNQAKDDGKEELTNIVTNLARIIFNNEQLSGVKARAFERDFEALRKLAPETAKALDAMKKERSR